MPKCCRPPTPREGEAVPHGGAKADVLFVLRRIASAESVQEGVGPVENARDECSRARVSSRKEEDHGVNPKIQ